MPSGKKLLLYDCGGAEGSRLTRLSWEMIAILKRMTQLEALFLTNNQLTALPDTIDNLAQLKVLYITMNPLETLPATFSNLTQLETLMLSGAKLATLPAIFGNLSKLKTLYITGLKTLPASLATIEGLKKEISDVNGQLFYQKIPIESI